MRNIPSPEKDLQSSEEKVRVECRCELVCEPDAACLMHERPCAGGSMEENRSGCGVCGVWMSRTNKTIHDSTYSLKE